MKNLILLALFAASLILSGCGLIYKPTGAILKHYSQDEVLPYSLGSGDLNKTACGTGRALGELMGSFGRVIARPAQTMISVNTLAAMCAEAKAQRAHLHMLRAMRQGDIDAARDARIGSQRLQRRTALRRYQVYKDTVIAYGE